MKFDTGCTICVIGYSLGDRRLFAENYTIEVNIEPKDNINDGDEWWVWLSNMFLEVTSILNKSIFLCKKRDNFEIKHIDSSSEHPKIQVVYDDGFTFTIPADWVVMSSTVMATHTDIANWIKNEIGTYIDVANSYDSHRMPGNCEITIVVWDDGEYAHTEIEFTPKQPTDKKP